MKRFLHLLIISLFPVITFSQTFEEKQVITKDYNKVNLEEMASSFQLKAELEKTEALELAKQNGWPVRYEENGRLLELMKVNKDGIPQYYSTYNINAAKSSRANTLHNGGILGLNIEGQNMEAHVWDGGLARTTHQEYDGAGGSNRFSIGDGTTGLHYHSAHVTGTIMASGYSANAKGMAPQADAVGYEWTNDVSEATTAANGGMLLSNHSYGWNILYVDDWQFGAYASDSRDWDVVMYNAPYYLMVVAAGNEGNDNTSNGTPLDGNSSYDKLSGHSTTKNNLVVANAQDANIDANGNLVSVSINSGSSEGPCDDYRIKPDITGNGTSLYSSYEGSDSEYGTISGTSMASPNVCGTLLLLQQYYNNQNSGFMKAATLKGLALHTADEAGPTGPDAVWGWGLLNGKEAANTISTNGAESTISELSLNNGGSYSINVDSDGVNDLIASISWTDPAGTANSGTVNLTTPVLVNDLDIRVTKGGSTYYPYRLTSITTNSNSGDNNVDPFEKVIIGGASGTYTITVTHKGSLSGGNQNYSLIITGKSDSPGVPVANFNADDVSPSVGQTVSFTDLSSGVPTSWSWSFSPTTVTYVGGTSSSDQYPQVTFDAIGAYTVTLQVTNGFGSDTEIKTSYINASNSSTETYISGDIQTEFDDPGDGTSSCPGSMTVNIPAGATITGVDVEYDMTAIGSASAWKSEQRSQLRCVSIGGTTEGTIYAGSVDEAGTQSYSRTGLTIANGVSGGGNISFELHAERTWGGSGCNTTYNKVDNNTWTVTVYYTPVAESPVADFSADNINPGIGQTVTFTDASANIPNTWAWSFSPSTVTYINSTNSSSQNPQVTFDAAGLYTVSLTATNVSGNDNETKVDYIDVSLYCDASGASSFLEITRVQLETIDNSSAQEYYGDFTYLSTDLNKYHSYDITINNDGSIQNADLGIWIDYNQDGDFDDAGENIVCDIDNYGDGTFNFSIPGTALAGTTRMRIRTKFSGSDCGSPCGPESNGEVEDYSVNLIEAFPGLWTGASSTDWGVATNWDDTNIPVAVTNVTIPSSPSGANFPEINSGSGAVCNNLTIEAGAHVNIPSDNTLTVNGTLTNNSGISGLVIQSSVSGTGSLLHNTAGINGSVRQYLTDDEWHYVSIPTSNAMSYVFYDIWLKPFVESTYSWGDNILNNISLGIMQGYAAWTYDVATVSFEGPFNNGLQTIDVTRNTVTTNQGYNLVGNPYPSAVDWDITDGWDKTYVDNTIYFWKGVGGSGGTGNYYYHNGGLGEVPDVSLGYNDLEDNGIIPAMQGFFVRATTDGTFEVNNEARVHSDQTYYKDDAENTLPLIRLRSENSASLFDETIIRFYSGATPEHDGDYDAFKLEGYLVPQLYSITPEQSKLAINTSPAYENGTIIPIGFIAHIEDEYSISLAEFENFNIETEVYLEDLKENEIQNLSLTPNYVFNGSPEDAAQRFNLHFSNPMSVDDNIMGSQISIYSYSNVVYVQKPSNFDGNVFIYDILGKEIYSSKAQGGGLASIPVTNGNGYYLVKVQSNADIKTEKVYIK